MEETYQGFLDLFGETRGNSHLTNRDDLQALGSQHQEIRSLLDQLEIWSLENHVFSFATATHEQERYVAQATSLADIFTTEAMRENNLFHNIRNKVTPLICQYLTEYQVVDRAFEGAVIAAQLKEVIPEELYCGLYRLWWLLSGNKHYDEAPGTLDISAILAR
jgi:hypothetical protein